MRVSTEVALSGVWCLLLDPDVLMCSVTAGTVMAIIGEGDTILLGWYDKDGAEGCWGDQGAGPKWGVCLDVGTWGP